MRDHDERRSERREDRHRDRDRYDDRRERHERHERRERSERERPRDDRRERHDRERAHRSRSRSPRRDGPGEAPAAQPGPVFERSGLLAKESNSMNGVALKYHEPPEAQRPKSSWRMFVFKDGKEVGTFFHANPDMLVLGRQSCYLFGRDRTVADIPIEHPSCSKQHAVIQFRQVTKRNEFGDERRYIQYVSMLTRPFLIDLDSANGCTVNNEEVPKSRYYEIRSGDTVQFGASSREYVLLDEAAAPS